MSAATWLRRVGLCCFVVMLGVFVPGWSQEAKGKKYALLVGVKSYDHNKLGDLKYTENDAEEMAKVLTEAKYDEVAVLTTTRGQKDAKKKPTKANVERELKRLLKNVTKHDVIVIGLSGHGVQYEVKQGNKRRDESFFCPSDARIIDSDDFDKLAETMLPFRELFKQLDDSGAGSRLLLVDACRNEAGSSRNADVNAMPNPTKGTAALFSCKGGERAYETAKLGKGHGVFFFHVIKALKGEGKDKRGNVTWDGLTRYVRAEVSDAVAEHVGGGAKQTPHLMANVEGDPVLVRVTKGAAKEPPAGEIDAHEALVHHLAVNPKGTALASAGFDKVVKLWRLPSMKPLRELKGHSGPVYCVAFDPKGDRVASASQDKTIRVWDAANGKTTLTLEGHTDTVGSIAYTPDGKHLLSGSADKSVRLWDAADGKELKTLGSHAGAVYSVAVSPDGKYFASAGSDKTIKIYSAANRKLLRELKGHEEVVIGLAFSPDGDSLASVSHDKTIRIWDYLKGREKAKLGPTVDDLYGLKFSGNGKALATSGYAGWVRVWNLGTGKETFNRKLAVFGAYSVVYSPGGGSLISAHDVKKSSGKIIVTRIE
jgi:hypothetical protein